MRWHRSARRSSEPDVVGGAFVRHYASPSKFLRATCLLARCRNHLIGWHLGDQAMFVRRSIFFQLGGFREVDQFEDLDFSRRLTSLGRIVTLHPGVTSSSRRFEQGAVARTMRDFCLTIGYLLRGLPQSSTMKPSEGSGVYNVVVIGAGTAGLVTAAGTAGLGGRVALIERNKMGGDCLNFGCVPSKALISSARLVHDIAHAEKWGLEKQSPTFSLDHVFERMRARRAQIAPNDSQERFESLGVDVFRGEARFLSPNELLVGGYQTAREEFRHRHRHARGACRRLMDSIACPTSPMKPFSMN